MSETKQSRMETKNKNKNKKHQVIEKKLFLDFRV